MPAALEEAKRALLPARAEDLIRELSTALALVSGVGMSEGEKKAWFAAAAMTLNGLPRSILLAAVGEARKVADHPSKIVPAILAAAAEPWERLKADERKARWFYSLATMAPTERQIAPPAPDSPVTPEQVEEMNRIMASVGAVTRYRPDGSRYETDTPEQTRKSVGPLRKPTRQDYIDMGVDPAVLDQTGVRQ